jgi:hypothetical protein
MSKQSPYLTLAEDAYQMAIGAKPLLNERLIEIDPDHYLPELALKQQILASDLHYYSQALPNSEPAQWEALEVLLTSLSSSYPEQFSLDRSGPIWHWHNHLANTQAAFRPGVADDLPYAALDWAGRQVQEDLLVLSADADSGFPLIAGSLCFANRWCLDDKIGQPLIAIHDPVPGFAEQIGRSSSLLLERLKTERPVWRLNWSILATGELNRATRFGHELDGDREGVHAQNAGQRCFFRTERQTITRLPRTNALLFTVHTYIAPIADLVADAAFRAKLIGVLHSAPPAIIAYKGMTIFLAPLLEYLEQAN